MAGYATSVDRAASKENQSLREERQRLSVEAGRADRSATPDRTVEPTVEKESLVAKAKRFFGIE